MVRLLALILVIPNLCFATVTLDFKDMPLNSALTAVFKGIVKSSFSVSPDIQASDKIINIYAKDIELNDVIPTLKNALNAINIDIQKKDNMYHVLSLPALTPNSFYTPVLPSQFQQNAVELDYIFATYKPKYRSYDYLSQIVRFSGASLPELKSSDTIIFSATKQKTIDNTLKALEHLDTKQLSVKIKAVLLEFTDNNDAQSSFTSVLTVLSDKLKISVNAAAPLSNFISLQTAGLSVLMSSIEGDSRFKYLSQPSMTLLNGEESKLQIGSEVPTLANTTQDRNGNALQSIEYKTSGVLLTVKPLITSDSVLLNINQELSNFSQTTTSQINSPTLLKRSLNTVVNSKIGEIVVLAGLDEEKETSSKTGFTFLPEFLHSKQSYKTKSQIVLLIELLPS
jgi:type II secretory pathway component GspD/PulD (secretin)